MKVFTKWFLSFLLLFVVSNANAATKEYELDQKLTSIAALDGQKFAIVNATDEKAFFGSTNQNLGYDTYATAFVETNTAISFRLVAAVGDDVSGKYYLQSVKPDGTDYSIWGGGYLNSQPNTEGKDCCFIMGLNGQNGQDGLNLAVWEIEENEGTFALKNFGTGKYLKTRDVAKYDDPTYFSFYTLKEKEVTDPLADEKDALSAAIEKGKLLPAIAYTDASFAAVGKAVTDGETALADGAATAESLTTATTAINNAIAALVLKYGFAALTADDFKAWDSATEPTTGSATGCSYDLFKASGLPYGDGNVGWKNFANLAEYDALYVTFTEGTPRIMMNRDVDQGQWNEDEAQSHLIEFPKGDAVWSAKYFTNENGVVTVDLKQMVADKGIANLNAIKGANWANVLVTGLFLYKDNGPAPVEVTFDFNASNHAVSTSSDNSGDITANEVNTVDGVVMTITPAASGTPNRYWGTGNGPQLRMYSGTMTIEAPEGKAIKAAVFNNGKWNAGNTINGEASTNEWAGNSTNLVLAVAANTQINKVVLTLTDKDEETTTYVVPSIANDPETAYSIATAIELIEAGVALSDVVYVKGIVSQVDKFDETEKYITYWISDDGTTTNQFECYHGKGIAGADFASIEDIEVGAEVIVKGTMTKYGEIYEFNQGNELYSYEAPPAGPWVTPGYYLLYNVGTGQFLTKGNGWGTQASITQPGLEGNGFAVQLVAVDNDFQIVTGVGNAAYGLEHLSGGTIYTDQSRGKQSTWNFIKLEGEAGFEICNIVSVANHGGGAGAYLSASEEGTIVGPAADGASPYAQWMLVSVDDHTALLAAMEGASALNPVDATALIVDANFSYPNIKKDAWTMEASNQNLCGGDATNPCAESWQSAFTLSQTLTGIPNGLYVLTAQAALTDYTGAYDGSDYPVVYANEESTPFNAMDEDDRGTSMTKLSGSFTAGKYDVEPLSVVVTDNTLTVGVKGTRTNTWCIWDNFELTYFGIPAVVLNAPTWNAEEGTQDEPNIITEPLKINYSAENLEDNGYKPEDLKVKMTVMVSGSTPNYEGMVPEHFVAGETFYIDLGETAFPVALKDGYIYQNITVLSADLVVPASEGSEEVVVATYAGEPVSLRWIGYEGDLDPAYDRAMAAIVDGQYYRITTVANGTKYYVTEAGNLTSVVDDGGIFKFAKTSGGAFKSDGFQINGASTRFTNPPLANNVANLTPGKFATATNNRVDWETQVLFLAGGKYAIRSCNTAPATSSWGDAGRTFWTWGIENVESDATPMYTYDPTYVWELEAVVPINVTYTLFESDGTTQVGDPITKKQEANSEIVIPADWASNFAYTYVTEGEIGSEDCAIKVTRTFKEGTVHALSDLSNMKAYTIRCDRGAFVTKDGHLASTAHGTLAKAEAEEFAIISYEENYYLYSVKEGKFVQNNGALAAMPMNGTEDALKMDAQKDPYFLCYFTISGTNNGLNTNGNDPYGYVINTWMNADPGNLYYMVESSDFDATSALEMLDIYFHPTYFVTYVVKDAEGKTLFTSDPVPTYPGAEITTLPAEYQRAFTTYNEVAITITEQNTTAEFTATWAGPFEFSADLENAKWYNMDIRSGWYVSKCEAEPYTMKQNPTQIELISPEFQWAFGGSPYGVVLFNGATGATMSLSPADVGDRHCAVLREGEYGWEIFPNSDGFVLRETGTTDNWINQSGGGNASAPLAFWVSSAGKTDNGSTFRIHDVPDAAEIYRTILQDAIAEAQAAAEVPVGGLFQKQNGSDVDTYKGAIVEAGMVAVTPEADAALLKSAIDNLAAATETFNAAPVVLPEAGATYSFQMAYTDDGTFFMNLEDGVKIDEVPTALTFVAGENAGEYYLKAANADLYVGIAGNNNWDMTTDPEKKATWTFTALADGSYTINRVGKDGLVGPTAVRSGEKVTPVAGDNIYCDKTVENGYVNWIINSYIAPVKFAVVPNIESGTQTEFTIVETGTALKLAVSVENLEANGYDPKDISLKVGTLFAGRFSDKGFAMGTNEMPPYMKNDIVLPLADEVTLADDVFGTEYPFIQSIRITDLSLMKGEEPIAASEEMIVISFIEVYENGKPVGIKAIATEGEKAEIFDLSGRKVEKVQRGGVYIINGKKVSVK